MTETVSDERLRELAQGYETWSKTNSSRPQIDKDTASALRELLALRTPPQNTDGEAVAWQADWPDDPAFPEWTLNRTTAEKWHERGAMITPLVPASALSAMKAERDEQHDIVARIWVQLGSPTYEQLAGCSIHDLIEELQDSAAREAAAEAERDALAQQVTLMELSDGDAAHWRGLAERAISERDALAKALEPFARHAEGYDSPAEKDGDSISGVVSTPHGRSKLLVGDLRRARSTLQGDAK